MDQFEATITQTLPSVVVDVYVPCTITAAEAALSYRVESQFLLLNAATSTLAETGTSQLLSVPPAARQGHCHST